MVTEVRGLHAVRRQVPFSSCLFPERFFVRGVVVRDIVAELPARKVKLYDSGDYTQAELAEVSGVARFAVGCAVERAWVAT